MRGLRSVSSRCRKCRDRSANLIDSLLIRTSFMLISPLSPTAILRAEAMLLNSSVVPRTIRRGILRPSGPAYRHLKHQTSGPRLRRSTVTPPSCIPSPFARLLNTLEYANATDQPSYIDCLERDV